MGQAVISNDESNRRLLDLDQDLLVSLNEKKSSFSDGFAERDINVNINSDRIHFSHYTFINSSGLDGIVAGFQCFVFIGCKISRDIVTCDATRFIVLKNTVVGGQVKSQTGSTNKKNLVVVRDSASSVSKETEGCKVHVSDKLCDMIIQELINIATQDDKLLQDPQHPFIIQELPEALTSLSM